MLVTTVPQVLPIATHPTNGELSHTMCSIRSFSGPSAILPHHLNVRVTRLGSEVVDRVGVVDPTPEEQASWHEMHILYDSLR